MPEPQPKSANPRRVSSGRHILWPLLREGLNGQRGWSRARAKAAPRPGHRAVIGGGGGHGLATALYPATEHSSTDVAVLEEKGPDRFGSVGRNTPLIRSNYFHPDNIRFSESRRPCGS